VLQSTPNPSDAEASILTAVSYSSATACTAVGPYVKKSGAEPTLAFAAAMGTAFKQARKDAAKSRSGTQRARKPQSASRRSLVSPPPCHLAWGFVVERATGIEPA